MSDKWGLGKKGYLKIHVDVNIRTKEVLASLDVTQMRKYMMVEDNEETSCRCFLKIIIMTRKRSNLFYR